MPTLAITRDDFSNGAQQPPAMLAHPIPVSSPSNYIVFSMAASQPPRRLLPSTVGTAASNRRSGKSAISPMTKAHNSDPLLAKTDAARWAILSSRSCPPSSRPPFIYAVVTTHIFCRPTCPARLARRANIIFFDTATDAVSAGYRACKRCKPDIVPEAEAATGEVVEVGDGEDGRRKVMRAVEVIREKAAQGQRIGLRELSEEVGLSRWHLLRIFRRRWGVTPKEMADGVIKEEGRRRSQSGSQTPVTLATETASSTSNAMPTTPIAGTAFDDALMDFDFAALDMDLTTPELWRDGEPAEDLLRDLFPEVYQHESK